MSVRKRIWKTAAGEERQAWIVDYADQTGKRRMKTFRLKKEADAFETRSRFEITQGTHTPDSASVTIAEAADLWIETCAGRRLERSTIDSYRQHIKFHILPFIGKIKLSQIIEPNLIVVTLSGSLCVPILLRRFQSRYPFFVIKLIHELVNNLILAPKNGPLGRSGRIGVGGFQMLGVVRARSTPEFKVARLVLGGQMVSSAA